MSQNGNGVVVWQERVPARMSWSELEERVRNVGKLKRALRVSVPSQEGRNCRSCQVFLPWGAFYAARRGLNGRTAQCRDCRKRQWLRTTEQNRVRARAWYHKNRELTKPYYRQYYQDHKERARELGKARYERNKERALELAKAWHAAHPEKVREAKRKWKKAHPENARLHRRKKYWRNIEKSRAEGRAAAKRNHHAHKVAAARRRGRQAQSEGTFTTAEWRALCARYDHRCLCCGASGRLQADHIVPLSKGGTTYIANIQPLCRTCNPRKRVQTIDYRKWWEGFEGAF